MYARAAAPARALLLLLSVFLAVSAPAQAQDSEDILSSPPNLRLEDMLDTLVGPDGVLRMGDAEYVVRRDPAAKGGVGIFVETWPGGVVPYVADASLTPNQRVLLDQAIRRWESVAPVDFVERTNQANYVRVVQDNVNASRVGMTGGEQLLRFSPDVPVGVVLHELGHALGMSHEHVRSDRDRYVRVLPQNIDRRFIHNFALVETRNCSQYDFGSIMHYGQDFFTVNGAPTLIPYPEYAAYAHLMGSRVDLTESDIQDVRAAYGAAACDAPPGPTPNPNPGPTPGPTPGNTPILDINLTGAAGHQRIFYGPEFNVPGLRAGWSDNLDFVTGAQGPDGVALVMARGRERALQHVTFNKDAWPGDFISEYWNQSEPFRISGVFGGPQGWTVIMSRVENVYVPQAGQSLENWGWAAQSTRLRDSWPRDVIREQWDEGKDITDIAYGVDGWALIFSRETHYGPQGWDRREDPREVIGERWSDGYAITDIAYGEGLWHVVATKNAGIQRQRWVRSQTFPEAQIRRAWDDGMHVQALDYGGGWWYVIFSERQ